MKNKVEIWAEVSRQIPLLKSYLSNFSLSNWPILNTVGFDRLYGPQEKVKKSYLFLPRPLGDVFGLIDLGK